MPGRHEGPLEGGDRFQYASVAERYVHRPPYPPQVFQILLDRIDAPAVVLDIGCGTGKLARGLAGRVDRVDAVDPSEEMLRIGRSLPDGDHPRLRWRLAAIETARLDAPYALACAGASIHWLDHDRVLPRLAKALTPRGVLALVEGDGTVDAPWETEERALMARYYERMTGERAGWANGPWGRERLDRPLLGHPLYRRLGVRITPSLEVSQRVCDYVALQHSRQTWVVDVMGEALAAQLDVELAALLQAYAHGESLRYQVRARVEWGRPIDPSDDA